MPNIQKGNLEDDNDSVISRSSSNASLGPDSEHSSRTSSGSRDPQKPFIVTKTNTSASCRKYREDIADIKEVSKKPGAEALLTSINSNSEQTHVSGIKHKQILLASIGEIERKLRECLKSEFDEDKRNMSLNEGTAVLTDMKNLIITKYADTTDKDPYSELKEELGPYKVKMNHIFSQYPQFVSSRDEHKNILLLELSEISAELEKMLGTEQKYETLNSDLESIKSEVEREYSLDRKVDPYLKIKLQLDKIKVRLAIIPAYRKQKDALLNKICKTQEQLSVTLEKEPGEEIKLKLDKFKRNLTRKEKQIVEWFNNYCNGHDENDNVFKALEIQVNVIISKVNDVAKAEKVLEPDLCKAPSENH